MVWESHWGVAMRVVKPDGPEFEALISTAAELTYLVGHSEMTLAVVLPNREGMLRAPRSMP